MGVVGIMEKEWQLGLLGALGLIVTIQNDSIPYSHTGLLAESSLACVHLA